MGDISTHTCRVFLCRLICTMLSKWSNLSGDIHKNLISGVKKKKKKQEWSENNINGLILQRFNFAGQDFIFCMNLILQSVVHLNILHGTQCTVRGSCTIYQCIEKYLHKISFLNFIPKFTQMYHKWRHIVSEKPEIQITWKTLGKHSIL